VKIVQVQTQAEAAGRARFGHARRRSAARGHDVRTVFMYRKTDAYDGDPYADSSLTSARGPLEYARAVLGLVGYMRRRGRRGDLVPAFRQYLRHAGGRLAGVRHLVANQSGEPGRYGGALRQPPTS